MALRSRVGPRRTVLSLDVADWQPFPFIVVIVCGRQVRVGPLGALAAISGLTSLTILTPLTVVTMLLSDPGQAQCPYPYLGKAGVPVR